MTMPGSRRAHQAPIPQLQWIDELITGYLSTLLDHTDDIKLPDFIKLVDLRQKLVPEEAPSYNPRRSIESARKEELPYSGSIEPNSEEPTP